MGLREILSEGRVCVRPGHGAEFERRAVWERPRYTRIVQAAQLVELLAGYHERGQVGRIDGKEDHRKHRPHIRHETRREASRRIDVYGRLVGELSVNK